MTGDRIAVIDLGSNTFHLLICEITSSGQWNTLRKERVYVKLAKGGIETIAPEQEQLAIDTMTFFAKLIREYNVKKSKAMGTAALREAKNGPALAEKLSNIAGIPIEIIDGELEAAYILKGIRSVLPELDEYGLIMDIGGGSVEFILFKKEHVDFSKSFKVGVAILYDLFHKSDPISDSEIADLRKFLEQSLTPLLDHIKKVNRYFLIGASGSFEILYDVLPALQDAERWAELDMRGLRDYMSGVIKSSLAERKKMPEIPVERRDYIVVAYLLIEFILTALPPERLYYCEYALKEGVVVEMIEILG